MERPIYLDYAATTPVHPEVAEIMMHYMVHEFGNAGSRTHEYGLAAKKAVERARKQLAGLVSCQPDEVIFTSGATESNNLAILGLREFGESSGRKHIVSTAIEHKAVLEPLEHLRDRHGFEVDFVHPDKSGAVDASAVIEKVRKDTLLVSVMHVNNETGIIQPIEQIAEGLSGSQAFLHVDAAQSFGKLSETLANPRLDFISVSGHKVFGPKGVGSLIARRRKFRRPPLKPLMFGGGQEGGLRPGTVPVHQIVGLGESSDWVSRRFPQSYARLHRFQLDLETMMEHIGFFPIGDRQNRLPTITAFYSASHDSEATVLALKSQVAISNGAACTSSSYAESHVFSAMGYTNSVNRGFIRISVGLTPETIPDISSLAERYQTDRLRISSIRGKHQSIKSLHNS